MNKIIYDKTGPTGVYKDMTDEMHYVLKGEETTLTKLLLTLLEDHEERITLLGVAGVSSGDGGFGTTTAGGRPHDTNDNDGGV